MMILLYVYLAGVGINTILCHGVLQNPTITKATTVKAFRHIALWPISFIIGFFDKS